MTTTTEAGGMEARVGRRVPRNVYLGDEPLFVAATPELAAAVVGRLNAALATARPDDSLERLRELSEAATPGEWSLGRHFEHDAYFLTDSYSNLADDIDKDDGDFVVAAVNYVRALLTLNSPQDRAKAAHWIAKAPTGTRIEFKASKRTLPQNDRMWAMLTDIAQQKQHAGRSYTPDQWKVIFMHACGREVQFIPSLDGSTFIPWGQSSSDLSKDEMTNLIEYLFAWGAENGIAWSDPTEDRDARRAA